VAGSLPHSNEAAGKASLKMEAMFHNLGAPHFFLTTTFDDSNSVYVQIYSNTVVDERTDVSTMSDDKLRKKAKLRNELRLNFPGICASMYEDMFFIILKEVVGWDMETGQATTTPRLFGDCIAVTGSTEEQGRTTLHSHLLIWSRQLGAALKHLNTGNFLLRNRAQASIIKNYDKVCSTELFGNLKKSGSRKRKIKEIFDHDCTVNKKDRRTPEVVDDQQLRNLRHKYGHLSENGVFMYCPDCSTGCRLKNEEAIEALLLQGEKIPGLTKYPDPCTSGGAGRLHAILLQHQFPSDTPVPSPIIDRATYNNHLSCHCSSCFKCNKKDKFEKKSHTDYECRMFLPQPPQVKTVLDEGEEKPYFYWNGEVESRPQWSIRPKRGDLDVFQNRCCPAIQNSKPSCNTNVNLLFDGPVMMYTTKYYCKGNQKDEQRDFKRVVDTTRKMILQRRHEGNRSEALRRVLRATFQHNSENVVGAPMAAFLTKHKSRFFLTHSFVWCPLEEMIKVLQGGEIRANISIRGNMRIVEKIPLNYLCRGREYEDLCLWSMLKDFKVAFVKYKGEESEDVLPFKNTSHFCHPSYIRNE